MKENFRIAFRNIFRNRKRSYLTISVMVFGIMFSVMGLSYLDGVAESTDNLKYSGDVLITHPDYPVREKSFSLSANMDTEKAVSLASGIQGIKTVSPRIRFGGMLYKGDLEKKGQGFGITESDYAVLEFDKKIYAGKFLSFKDSTEIMVGRKLADELSLSLGDTVTILTSSRGNSISALNYKVTGFYDLGNGRLNKSFFITLSAAQDLLDMAGTVTECLFFLDSHERALEVKKLISAKTDLLVRNWQLIGLNGQMVSVMAWARRIMLMVFCFLSGIAIVNTMMMVVFERRREIGIFKALGMTDWQIGKLICLEGTLLGFCGALIGAILGGAVALFFSIHGINFGSAVERMPDAIKIKSVVYFHFGPGILITGLLAGTAAAFLATLLPVIPGVRKAPSELLKE
ncbi:MAG: ABC transporter permease [Candidatus Wallbacteria bacterium]|nr:ABC transporter permease [Candidatus Wallbacteria bacterium]